MTTDPTKIGIIHYLEERIKGLEHQLIHKRHSSTMRDMRVQKRTLESVLEWVKK